MACFRACRPTNPFPQPPPTNAPRVYACHDLAGGYADDAAVAGCFDPADASPYLFHHWHAIDAFIYFSHATVAPPPPGWIDAAHAHGVACLGTLIFEHESGQRDIEAATSSRAAADAAAAALARAAAYFGFDGWLLNVEVELPVENVPHLIYLVEATRAAVKKAVPHGRGETIWYDAVTVHGKLHWQNAWNDANAPLAAAADGAWLNYQWSPVKLKRSVAAAHTSNHPPASIIAGWDAWGRGTYGGGGVAGARVAAAAAAEAGVSFGVFAPGWAWEAEGAAGSAARADALWRGVSAAYGRRRRPLALPFHSAFFGGACGGGWWADSRAHPSAPWLHVGAAHAAPAWQTHVQAAVALVLEAGGRVRVALSIGEAAVVSTGPHGATPTAADWPPATPRRGGCVLALRGAVDAAAPLADVPLFWWGAATVVARGAVRGGAALALVGDASTVELALVHTYSEGWEVVQGGALAHTLSLRWPRRGGAFAAAVGETAVAPPDWAPGVASPAAGAVTVASASDGSALVQWHNRAGGSVARWSVFVARGAAPPRWACDAVASRAHVGDVRPGDAVIVQAQWRDGRVEAGDAAARVEVV